MSKHIQTQSEWEQTMARRVMEQLRGELYLDQRYLTAALGARPPAPQAGGGCFATDGAALYYPTAWVLDTYRKNRRYLLRLLPENEEKIQKLLPRDVADPWYSGNFEKTYEDLAEGCRRILEEFA